LDANIRATHYLVDHLRDPFGIVDSCQPIEGPVGIPFVHTVRAAELRWWNRYLSSFPIPKFIRDRDGLREKSTQTCQAIQNSIRF
jgi:hypothetical protein